MQQLQQLLYDYNQKLTLFYMKTVCTQFGQRNTVFIMVKSFTYFYYILVYFGIDCSLKQINKNKQGEDNRSTCRLYVTYQRSESEMKTEQNLSMRLSGLYRKV